MTAAYPLQWPAGLPRTEQPQRSRFDVTFDRARRQLQREIDLLGGRLPVLSSNVQLRMDGEPYAGRRDPEDTGVAVYFQLDGAPMAFACDRWDRVKDNIRAIQKAIEALRGMDRWGVSEARRQAFAGFQALPPPHEEPELTRHWADILKLDANTATTGEIKKAFNGMAKLHHPDKGGDAARFAVLIKARDRGLKEVKS